jgi:hypothetical protein
MMPDDATWVRQWVQWPTTHTTGGECWRFTLCLVRRGCVVGMSAD